MARRNVPSIFEDPNLPYNEPLTYARTEHPWHDFYTVMGLLLVRIEAREAYLSAKAVRPDLAVPDGKGGISARETSSLRHGLGRDHRDQ